MVDIDTLKKQIEGKQPVFKFTGRKNKKGDALYTITRSAIDRMVLESVEKYAEEIKKDYDARLLEAIPRIHSNTLLVLYDTLHSKFGFGKDRLNRLSKHANATFDALTSTDEHGERYLTFDDLEKELSGMGLDFYGESVKADEQVNKNMRIEEIPHMNINSIYYFLKNGGHEKACEDFAEYWGDKLKVEDL